MMKKSDISEVKEIIRKAMDDVYGFPGNTSPKKKRFLDLVAERLYERFKKSGKKKQA